MTRILSHFNLNQALNLAYLHVSTWTNIQNTVSLFQCKPIQPLLPQNAPQKQNRHRLHTFPAILTLRYTITDVADMCINTQQVIEHPHRFSNRSNIPKKAKTPLWKSSGSPPTACTGLKLEQIHDRYIPYITSLIALQARRLKKLRKGRSTKNAI